MSILVKKTQRFFNINIKIFNQKLIVKASVLFQRRSSACHYSSSPVQKLQATGATSPTTSFPNSSQQSRGQSCFKPRECKYSRVKRSCVQTKMCASGDPKDRIQTFVVQVFPQKQTVHKWVRLKQKDTRNNLFLFAKVNKLYGWY